MTPAQCRGARGLIAMSQSDLAKAAVVPAASIADFETGAWLRREDIDAIQKALERAGVEFIERGVRQKDGSTSAGDGLQR
jgi:predicted transcriptional regulator